MLEKSWKRESAHVALSSDATEHLRAGLQDTVDDFLTLVRQRLFRRLAVRGVGRSHADRRDRRPRQDARLLLGKLRAAAGAPGPAAASRQHLSQPRVHRDHRADPHLADGLHVPARDPGAASAAARGEDRSHPAPRDDPVEGDERDVRERIEQLLPRNAAGTFASASSAARSGRSRIDTTGRAAACSSRTSAS